MAPRLSSAGDQPDHLVPGTSGPASGLEADLQAAAAQERAGRLDAATIAGLETRLQALSAHLEKEVEEAGLQARAHAGHALAPGPSPAIRMTVGALAFFTLAGLLLEVTLGNGFVMAGGEAYRGVVPWVAATTRAQQ